MVEIKYKLESLYQFFDCVQATLKCNNAIELETSIDSIISEMVKYKPDYIELNFNSDDDDDIMTFLIRDDFSSVIVYSINKDAGVIFKCIDKILDFYQIGLSKTIINIKGIITYSNDVDQWYKSETGNKKLKKSVSVIDGHVHVGFANDHCTISISTEIVQSMIEQLTKLFPFFIKDDSAEIDIDCLKSDVDKLAHVICSSTKCIPYLITGFVENKPVYHGSVNVRNVLAMVVNKKNSRYKDLPTEIFRILIKFFV